MIETTLIRYLEKLGIPVYAEMPVHFHTPLVIVERTAGGRTGPRVHTATFAVQCYEASLLETAKLANHVLDFMEGFAEQTEICACRLNAGPYEFNHPNRKEYRYQLVYDITFYEE